MGLEIGLRLGLFYSTGCFQLPGSESVGPFMGQVVALVLILVRTMGTVREQIQLEAQSLSTDLMYKLNQLGDLICQNVLYVR